MSLSRRERMGVGAFLTFWFFCVLANLAFWGGVIYVAWHFISKYW